MLYLVMGFFIFLVLCYLFGDTKDRQEAQGCLGIFFIWITIIIIVISVVIIKLLE